MKPVQIRNQADVQSTWLIVIYIYIGPCISKKELWSLKPVSGKFVDYFIRKDSRNLIIAKSVTNDDLGYPFPCLAFCLKMPIAL